MALAVSAMVLLAHARYHDQLLLALLGAALAAWGFFEARHALRRRHMLPRRP